MSIPFFYNFIPPNNFPTASQTTPIFFVVRDANGLLFNTLNIAIKGSLVVINGIAQPGYHLNYSSTNPLHVEYHIRLVVAIPFLFGDTIEVAANIKNQLNVQGNCFFKFFVVENTDTIPPYTIPTPRGSKFNSPTTVTLNAFDAFPTPLKTYYTLNGGDPVTQGVLYTTPIVLNLAGEYHLKFYSRDDYNANPNKDNLESVKEEVYYLDFTPAVTTASISGGSYLTVQTVELNSNKTTTIYYTTNGTSPNFGSSVYLSPIPINREGTTVLKFFSVDEYGNVETIRTETYNLVFARSNFAPTNVMVISPYVRGKLDVVWDDMERIDSSVTGYNVYRSYFMNGEYVKLNAVPITTTSYRDSTTDIIIKDDVSDQFRQTILINQNANDNFSGNTIDADKWIEHDQAEIISQYDSLIISDLGSKQQSDIISIFKMRGNFDIQVELDLIEWISPITTFSEIGFGVYNGKDGISVARKITPVDDILESKQVINRTSGIPVITHNTQTIITLRMIRNNNLITTSFLNSIGNNINHATFECLNDVYIRLYVVASDIKIEARFYNFIVNFGEAVIIRPLSPLREYIIKTSHRPIVDSVIGGTGNTKFVDLFDDAHTNRINYVKVLIDGIEARIKKVYGLEGEIVLDTERYFDDILHAYVQPIIPNEYSKVEVFYTYRGHDVDNSLRKPLYYKVTLEHNCGETDLSFAAGITLQPDSLDWIYAEGMRRNSWILDQVGESVLLFIKSMAGIRCSCYLETERTHRQPKNKCPICYGVGFLPPYAPPICIKMSPAMAEQKLTQTDRGIRLDFVTEVWTICSHIINQRDFIVRKDGTILGIGSQTVPEVRGRRLDQQHFNIQPVDRSDVRYDYIESLNLYDNRRQLGLKCESIITEATSPCTEIQTKGRTLTFENIL